MRNKIEKRVKKVMSYVFNISEGSIKNNSSADTIESWDSLKHMNLVIALEEEFLVQFTDNDIIDLMNTELIVEIILEKVDG